MVCTENLLFLNTFYPGKSQPEKVILQTFSPLDNFNPRNVTRTVQNKYIFVWSSKQHHRLGDSTHSKKRFKICISLEKFIDHHNFLFTHTTKSCILLGEQIYNLPQNSLGRTLEFYQPRKILTKENINQGKYSVWESFQ